MFKMFDVIANGSIYTIAEMSANHAGKLDNALKLVWEAKKSGADCLKIQTYTADTLTIDCKNEYFRMHGGLWDGSYLYDLYKEAYTPWEWQKLIKEECDKAEIDFLSTPFDRSAVDFLESIGCEAYKIASFEIVDIPLIEYVASKGKPMIISCGMASEEDINDALNACYRNKNEQVVLLKCCSEYPSRAENLNLCMIEDMCKKFNVPVGISDHSLGYLADIVAVAKGAKVIEKHFCLSREIKNADSDFSMEPEEFKEMVCKIKEVAIMSGNIFYGPSEGEKEEFRCRRSLFAVENIKKGEIITEKNIRSIRPNNGLAPKYMKEILGKQAIEDIEYGTPIKKEMFK